MLIACSPVLAQENTDILQGQWVCFALKEPAFNDSLAVFFVDGKVHHIRDNQHYPGYFLYSHTKKDNTVYQAFTKTSADKIRYMGKEIINFDVTLTETQSLLYRDRKFYTTGVRRTAYVHSVQPCFTYKSRSFEKEKIEARPAISLIEH